MSNQLQCPNCGGYKLESGLTKINPKTGKKLGSGCSAVFWMSVVVTVISIGVYNAFDEGIANGMMIMIVFPLLLIGGAWYGIASGLAKNRAYNLYNFRCNLCGYRWEWQQGTPYPKVNVRQDLIAQGEQLLEEKRKQQENMEALYYLTHKK